MAEGHRQRLKSRFLEYGLDTFNEINALELMLFYALPRQDTNPLAHRLLDRFGSFAGVLDADYAELIEVEGVSDHTATFLKTLPDAARYYQRSKLGGRIVLPTLTDIGEFLVKQYVGVTSERVLMLMLDNGRSLISCEKLHEGSVSSAAVSIRMMAELALKRRAAAIVLAHNHPSGIAVPSPDDIMVTREFKNAMITLEIEFIDHFIIADNRYCTILNKL
ncbi:MAG: DNA repair protein RadC [Clostridia bacterium]|nr:DNA repair protein RadC [Clostridia bacterium]